MARNGDENFIKILKEFGFKKPMKVRLSWGGYEATLSQSDADRLYEDLQLKGYDITCIRLVEEIEEC